jgi:geranylgeranyl diphosphate synthase, type II
MTGAEIRLEESWQTLKSRVDARLSEYMQVGSDCPARLQEAMAYSLLAGGKRLRPVLVLLACEACGGDLESALPAACAIEMVHTYSLIHDDLPAMDDDDLRRGRPTNHVVFGEAQAILAGDGLLTLAFEVLAADVRPSEIAAACCADLASAAGVCGMVGGQVADLEAAMRTFSREKRLEKIGEGVQAAEGPSEADRAALLEQLEAVHARKTGRLLACALSLGGRIARADAQLLDSLKKYGKLVGLAFQITDDLLDLTGDVQKMGKGVRKDADHGKLTYPSLLGEERSRRRACQLVEEACRSIVALGERGRRLEELAQFVIGRDY